MSPTPPMHRSFGRQLLLALDQLANVLAQGWADETISSRAFRESGTKRRWKIARWVIDNVFFFWQDQHCFAAHLAEIRRFQQPPSNRKEQP